MMIMMDELANGNDSQWVCPNDRQLVLRAKLQSGWSFHSNSPVRKSAKSSVSEEEKDAIKQKLEQAEKIKQLEQERICRLVEKLENMRNNALGDGVLTCLLCNSKFGVLKMVARKCDSCQRSVCEKCGVDSPNSLGQRIWLCMLCSEHREMWKKTGAWFYKAIPNYTSTQTQVDGRRLTTSSTHSESLLNVSPHIWRKLTGSKESLNENAHADSDGEADSSSDDDFYSNKRSTSGKRSFPRADDFVYKPSVDMSSTPGGKLLESIESDGFRKRAHALTRHPSDDQWRGNDAGSSSATESAAGDSVDGAGRRETQEEDLDELFKTCRDSHQPDQPESSTGFGSLEFNLVYDKTNSKLDITVFAAKNLKAMDLGGTSDPYVKLHLLPGASKSNKLRTHTKYKTLNPIFNETLTYYGITEEQVAKKTLRLQVLDEDTVGHNNFIGETSVVLNMLQYNPNQKLERTLHEESAYDNTMETAEESLGRIELSLMYQMKIGILNICVVRCAGLAAMDSNGYSDPYVKCYLKPDPHKKSKRRTSVKKKTLNPEFHEEFIYEITHSDLAKKSLEISVWDHDVGRSNDFIGGIVLDMKAKGTALKQWYETLKVPNETHTCWHTLEKITPSHPE